MMSKVREWWGHNKGELERARRESTAAREEFARKVKEAKARGATVQLSRAALQRISHVEEHS